MINALTNASDQHVPLFLLLVWEVMGWGNGELAIAAHLTDATNSAVRTFLRPILLPLFCDGSLFGVVRFFDLLCISLSHAHSSSVHPLHIDVQASCEKKWSSLLCDAPVPRSKGLQAEQVFPTPVVPRAQPA